MTYLVAIGAAVLLSLVGVIADMYVKLAGSGKQYLDVRWLVIGMLIYAATALGWFVVMKHMKLSVLGVYYAISTVLFLTLVSVFFFKERLTGIESLGIILAIVSLVLLARFA